MESMPQFLHFVLTNLQWFGFDFGKVGNKAMPSINRRNLLSITALCVFPSVLSVILSFVLEAIHYTRQLEWHEFPIAVAAALLCIIAVPLTHGLSGKQLYPKTWQFYQPLMGGWKFIMLQLFSWLCFVVSLLVFGSWFILFLEREPVQKGWWASAGVAAFASESLMLASLQVFDASPIRVAFSSAPTTSITSTKRTAMTIANANATITATTTAARKQQSQFNAPNASTFTLVNWFKEALLNLRMYLVLILATNLSFLLAGFLIGPFLLFKLDIALLVAVTFWSIYALTYRNNPADTGSRRWEAFRNSFMVHDIRRYFKGQVIVEGAGQVDQSKPYIFAFAPHGVMPFTGAWLPVSPMFRENFPQMDVVTLGASIFHQAPIVRDMPLWMGSRQVTRHTFLRTLQEGKSVFMVPGGVAELCWSSSYEKKVNLVTWHKGFVKLAMETGTDLIPVFSFGETLCLDFVNIPVISSFLLRYLKTPFPYFRGVAEVFQFPRRQQITVVIGKPIKVPHIVKPTQEQVDEIHKQYYDAIVDLFERYKERANHADYELKLLKYPPHHAHGSTSQNLTHPSSHSSTFLPKQQEEHHSASQNLSPDLSHSSSSGQLHAPHHLFHHSKNGPLGPVHHHLSYRPQIQDTA